MIAPRRHARRAAPAYRAAAMAAAALMLASAAQAETSPYYVGVQQRLTQVSNLRLYADGLDRSSLVSSTALLAGIDQPFGRQRARADLTLQHNSYSGQSCADAGCVAKTSNSQLNNASYDLSAALDWSTIERVSGTVSLAAGQRLSPFDTVIRDRNIEKTLGGTATVRVGVVTDLTFEASLAHEQARQSEALYNKRDVDQDSISLGMTYRPSSALSLGVSARHTRVDFPLYLDKVGNDGVGDAPNLLKRNDLDLRAIWVATGASSINARLSFTRWTNSDDSLNDFSGVTGSIGWDWKPTGKIQVNSRLDRDSGTESRFRGVSAGLDDSQIITSGRVRVSYEATAKITLNTELKHTERTLVQSFVGDDRGDRTDSVSLGARWTPIRPLLVGCDIGHEQRSSRGFDIAVRPSYTNNTYGCFAQFILK